jgi:UDP-N-acetylmuramyl pentapeptide phosphotransferase/UDP-N-acetylglucosamine-1-phosphate transferase
MPAHSSRNADSFGVVIVLAFLGGCWSLVGGAVDAGFADHVGRAAGRAWPFVLTTLVLWAIAAAAELAAHLRESRETLPLTMLLARSVAVAVVWFVSLAIAVGVVNLVGMTDGLLGLATVLAGWVRVSAGPVRRLLRPSAATPRPAR